MRGRDLDQESEVLECSEVGDAGSPLHVVRHDEDRLLGAPREDELIDLRGRNRVERAAGLVHEQHLGIRRDRARNAEPLPLAARKLGRARVEAALHLVPERGRLEASLDDVVEDSATVLVGDPQRLDDVLVEFLKSL